MGKSRLRITGLFRPGALLRPKALDCEARCLWEMWLAAGTLGRRTPWPESSVSNTLQRMRLMRTRRGNDLRAGDVTLAR